MITKLKNWLRKRLASWLFPDEEVVDTFSVKERHIYHYFDGQKVVHADPMILWKKVMANGNEINADIAASRMPQSKFARPAWENLITRLREIFAVKSLEEGGLTEQETVNLFDHFMLYCHGAKKKPNEPPTTPGETSPPTPSPAGPSGGPPPTTTSGSVSSRTETESSGEGPPSQPTGSPSVPAP